MNSLNSIFNAQQSLTDVDATDTSIDFTHPDGRLPATVEKSELRENSTGSGKHVSVMFRTDRGTIWLNFNVLNTDEETQAIGRHQLKLLSNSLGFSEIPSICSAFIGYSCMVTIHGGDLIATLPHKEVIQM